MSDALATYLHDHLAGSHFAIDLLESLQKQYPDTELGGLALTLLDEIRYDQTILEQIIERVGEVHFDLAEAIGWIGEKASRFKLHRDSSSNRLGTLEALEVLTLGVRGKWALWQTLSVVRDIEPRLDGYNFAELSDRAEQQFEQLEEQRLKMARITFQPSAVVHR